MTENEKIKPLSLWRFGLAAFIIWTLLITTTLGWNYTTEKAGILEAARIHARAAFEKDVLYRRWNAGHGGVYAPVSETTQPNPYLRVFERDIETPSGIKLTKVNPAFMTRQVHEIALNTSGIKGHITSLKPIRPENAPDPWEAKALMAFQTGEKEISFVENLSGIPHMRLMRPLVTEAGCLKCHAYQGYKIGDIRGGISVSVPLTPLIAIERSRFMTFTIIDGMTWLIGLIGIGLALFFLNRQIKKRLALEARLRQHERMEGVVEMAGAVCHELNQPLQSITGYTELLILHLDAEDPGRSKLQSIQQQVERMAAITKKLMGITRYETTRYADGKIIDLEKSSDST